MESLRVSEIPYSNSSSCTVHSPKPSMPEQASVVLGAATYASHTSTQVPGTGSYSHVLAHGSAPSHAQKPPMAATRHDQNRSEHVVPAPAQSMQQKQPNMDPPRRSTTSTYQKPCPTRTEKSELCGAKHIKRSALYVGEIDPECCYEAIVTWCKNREVEIISCSISESKYFGTAYAHVE